jgi:tRNA uridine 5-carbamoylmethylation protein Kti12
MTSSKYMTVNQIIEKYVKQAQTIQSVSSPYSKILIAFIGIPGSGKTTLSKSLSQLLPAVRIASDDIKLMLYGDDEYDINEFFKVQQLAIVAASQYASVISDANSDKKIYRDQLLSIAKSNSQNCFFIKCQIDIEIASKRVQQRQHRFIVPIERIERYYSNLEDPDDALVLNTGELSIEECISKIIRYVS